MDDFLTAPKAAQHLRMSYAQFNKRARPFIKYHQLSKRGWRYYRVADLDRWVKNSKIDPTLDKKRMVMKKTPKPKQKTRDQGSIPDWVSQCGSG